MPIEVVTGSWIAFGSCLLILLVQGFFSVEGRIHDVFARLPWISLVAAVTISIFYHVTNPPPPLPTHQQQLQNVGLVGEHNVFKIHRQDSSADMSFAGNYFSVLGFGGGSIQGGSKTPESSIQFFWGWVHDGIEESRFTTLPQSRIAVVIDETKAVPTIEFLFYREFLSQRFNSNAKGSYDVTDEVDPNNLLAGEGSGQRFRVALVRISPQDLAKEIYLPEPKQ